MNPKTIAWIDKNIGCIICFFLTLHRQLCDLFVRKKSEKLKPPAKVLFIKLTEQGSIVLAYAALKKAADLVEKKNVYFIVFKRNRHILDILNIFSPANIIEVNSKNFFTFVVSMIRALIRMRREKIDAVVDFEFFSRASAIIAYLSGARMRVGFHRFNSELPYRGDLFSHKLIYNPYLHTKVLFVTLVEALNHNPAHDKTPVKFDIPKIDLEPAQFLPEEDEKKILIEKIEKQKNSPLKKPVIIFNPDIKDLLKIRKWPEENYVTLANLILKEFPESTIIITGTSRESQKAKALGARLKNAVSVAGMTSFRELLTLYCISDCLITSDGGPAHFSMLTPVKTVVLFGPETPILYGREGKDIEIMSTDLNCSPCINVYNHRMSPCRDNICLKKISPDEVYNRVKKFLKR